MLKRTKSDLLKVFYIFFIWRLSLFLIAFVAPTLIVDFGARFPYFEETLVNTHLPYWLWSFGNFDGVHYLRIAQDSYAYQYTQAFFPFYPILIKILSYVTFGNFLIAALVISNVAFLMGIMLFYKLIKKNYDEKIAFWSCLFLLTSPTSFYFGSVYTEGIFFLMIIGTFYLLEKNKIFLASIVGSFASATRLVGLFLAPSLVKRRDIKVFIPLLIVPFGLILYMIYLAVKFDNPFYFLTAQSIWGQ